MEHGCFRTEEGDQRMWGYCSGQSSAQAALEFHELPLVPDHSVPRVNLVVGWTSFCKVVNVLYQSGLEPFPEGEAELQSIRVPSLLN